MNEQMKEKASYVSEKLKALSHPKRLYIVCLIKSQEMSVSQIEEESGLSQSQTSQVLNDLRRQDILSVRKEGKQSFYRLKDQNLEKLIETIYYIYCEEEL